MKAKFINDFLNENRNFTNFIKFDGITLPIEIISKSNWPNGKHDPTEFSDEDNCVKIREDYDYKTDPLGWLRHEYIHYKLYNDKSFKDDGKIYPYNNTESAAYTYQFKYLKKKGYKNLEDIKTLNKNDDLKILKKYWDKA